MPSLVLLSALAAPPQVLSDAGLTVSDSPDDGHAVVCMVRARSSYAALSIFSVAFENEHLGEFDMRRARCFYTPPGERRVYAEYDITRSLQVAGSASYNWAERITVEGTFEIPDHGLIVLELQPRQGRWVEVPAAALERRKTQVDVPTPSTLPLVRSIPTSRSPSAAQDTPEFEGRGDDIAPEIFAPIEE